MNNLFLVKKNDFLDTFTIKEIVTFSKTESLTNFINDHRFSFICDYISKIYEVYFCLELKSVTFIEIRLFEILFRMKEEGGIYDSR